MIGRLLNESTLVLGFLRAGIYMGTLFGLSLTEAQMAAVIAFVESGLMLLQRTIVTPVHLARERLAQGMSPIHAASEQVLLSEVAGVPPSQQK